MASYKATLQLEYNNWDNSEGFVDDTKNQDFHELVTSSKTQMKWLLSDEHLCLSKGILPRDIAKKWKTIDEDWRIVTPRFKDVARNADKNRWLDELEQLFQKRFEEDFRIQDAGDVGGVENFYRRKSHSKEAMIKEIRQHIEKELFTEWQEGTKSIYEIVELMAALIQFLIDRRKGIEGEPDKDIYGQLAKQEFQEKQAREQVERIKVQWSQGGFLAFFKKEKLFNQQAENLKELYRHKTWVVALNFAVELLSGLIRELQNCKSQIDECEIAFKQAATSFKEMMMQHLKDDSHSNVTKPGQLFEPDLIKEVTRRLTTQKLIQAQCANDVREGIINRITTSSPNFLAITQLGGSIKDSIISVSTKNAQKMHDRLIDNPNERLFGVSIIEKLKRRYGDNPHELRLYTKRLVDYACNYLSFDNAEIAKRGLGIPDERTRVSSFAVILPKATQYADFVDLLKAAFQQSYSGDDSIAFIESPNAKPYEIVMINITNLFPLRFVTHVRFLRNKYKNRLKNQNTDRLKLELHTEGDGNQFPNLFVRTSTEVKKESIPYLLLAKALDLIVQTTHSRTGAQQFEFLQKDEDGFSDNLLLGETFISAYEKLDVVKLEEIKQQVETLITSSDYVHKDNRHLLKVAVVDEVERIKTQECENDRDSEIYQRFHQGGKKAVQILNV